MVGGGITDMGTGFIIDKEAMLGLPRLPRLLSIAGFIPECWLNAAIGGCIWELKIGGSPFPAIGKMVRVVLQIIRSDLQKQA